MMIVGWPSASACVHGLNHSIVVHLHSVSLTTALILGGTVDGLGLPPVQALGLLLPAMGACDHHR